MICIYISILCAYMMLYLLSRREEGKNPFHKMAAYILRQKRRLLRKTQGRGRSPSKDVLRRQLEDKLRTLQPGVSASRQADEFSVSQYGTMLAAVFAGVLICSAVWWSAHGSPVLKEGGYIQRNTYGGGSIPVELAAEVNGEEELFQYVVEERKYTESQAEELYQKAADSLPEIIRGTNDSLEDVRHDLDLITHIDGFPFEVTWESSSYAIVDTDGRVNNEDLEESVIVTLTARFQYDSWSWEHQIYVQVRPVVYTRKEELRSRIEASLDQQQENTGSTEIMKLPDSVDSQPIVWRQIIQDSSKYLFLLVLLAAGCIYWSSGRELDRRIEQRKRELLLDYPEIVNKLVLYMSAGMTIRNSFFKMGEDYKKQQEERKRYAYEEILITCNELQSGRSENEAYDHFGKRCQVSAYMKLSTLLSQNLRKGSSDLLYMLRQEAENAFAERKSLAKKLGEEAGTKLLLPMMMMLCIVMVIIMIPAYFSFTV